MTLKALEKIFPVATTQGDYLAFHTERLELASISEEAYRALTNTPHENPNTSVSKEALEELTFWAQQEAEFETPQQNDQGLRTNKVNRLVINSTQICNLKCTYCAAGGDGTYGDPISRISVSQTIPQISFIISRLSEGDTLNLAFIGGEPLLEPSIIELIYKSTKEIADNHKIQLKVVITTNGTFINESALEALKNVKAAVNISLDGPPEVNDQFRPSKTNKSTTKLVLEGLSKIMAIKHDLNGVGLTAVFTKEYTDVVKTYLFFREFNVDWYEFNFSHTENSTIASENFIKSLTQTAALAWEAGQETELRKIRSYDHFFNKLDNRIKTKSYCGIGKNMLVLDARNNIFLCPWHVGNKSKKYGSLEFKPDFKIDSFMNTQKDLCHNCWAKNLCGGGCEFIHSNHLNKFDKSFCFRIQSLIQDTFSYYEKSRRD